MTLPTRGPHATQPEPRPARPGWLERHQRYAARAAAGPIDLLFLGDSITQRWDTAPAVWERWYGQRRAVPMGIDNDGTQQLLWRLAHLPLEHQRPRLAVILIGINNIGNDAAAPDELAAGILAVVAETQRRLPTTPILLLGLLPYGAPLKAGDYATIPATNQRLAAHAAQADPRRLQFRDLGHRFLDPTGQVDRRLLHDGVHPSAAGYDVLARALEPDIAAALGPLPANP
jgi:beta-glucosidase